MSNNTSHKRSGANDASNSKSKKSRKRPSDGDDSDSSHSEQHQEPEPERALSPMVDDEPRPRLPEGLLRSFYKTPGVLLISGLVSWDMVAKRDNNPKKRSHPNLYTFHKFTARKYRLIVSGCSSAHSILVSEEGEAYTFGRNNYGQLGFGDTATRDYPEVIPVLKGKNIIHAAAGRNHSLFVTDTGAVYACGDNRCGQCGIGIASPNVLSPTRVRLTGPPAVKVGCGTDFSVVLDCNGALYSFGLPEYGQLGHNTDGKYFVTSTKMSFHFETVPKHIPMFFEKSKEGYVFPVKDVVIVDFSCGNNHTVAIDTKKRAFSWGFGGFGRLGHAEQKDESVPRLIKYFETQARGVRSVHCGATYSLAVNDLGSLFMFGQTKRTGEANMYPKPVHDLAGWNIRCVGTGNTSIVMAADETLIAWGVAPTYGELGMGEINKSTARPREVSRMEGYNITQVAMGFSHTLLLCDNTPEAVQLKLNKMPRFEP